MSRLRVVLIAVAIVCGLLAGVLAKGLIGKKAKTEVVEVNKVPMSSVLIATKDMAMGEKLSDGSMSWREWPKANITATMISKDASPDALNKLIAARARLPIFEGEPISDKKLILPDQTGFMSALLPKGMRAISVAISERSAAGGFILPNDRVDVILTRKIDNPGTSQKIVKSETVVTNVKVLAINQTYRQEGDDKVTVTEGKTATLELNPLQTEVISMIESAGELSLALRSIAENGDKGMDDGGPRLADKYSGATKKSNANDRLFVRYGIESYTSSR